MYLGLREDMAANEDIRSFIYESTHDRTPLGHAHREQIRDLSIPEVREMYRQAIARLLNEVAETEEFFRTEIVGIDITEDDPSRAIERATKTRSLGRKNRPTSMRTSGQ